MECEICGNGEAEYLILIEGAKLNVCQRCSGSGKILKMPQNISNEYSDVKKQGPAILEIVEDYGIRIQNARKKLGIGLDVLAEKLNEKLSFLERIEKQRTLPDERLAKKLEKELGIILLEESADEASENTNRDYSKGVTLGDIIEIQRKKKND